MSWKYPWSEQADKRRAERRPQPKPKEIKIASKTKDLAKQDRMYSKMRKVFLGKNPTCQCGQPGCTGISTQVHHKRGRGIWFLIVKYWLAVCASCHEWIEKHPAEAKEKGFSENRIT